MRDDRETARIWASFIYLAMQKGINTTHHGADLDLAFLINEANALRVAAEVACKIAGLDRDRLLDIVRARLATRITKRSQKYFERKRRSWEASWIAQNKNGEVKT